MSVQPDRQSRQEQQKLVKKIKNYIYDPAQVIGSGFSSNVYKGINELNGQTIAIKVLELTKIQTEVEKYLLNNEINALRALTHPHVLRTVEILMTKNNVYIMTEFCENGDLQQYVKRLNRLSESESLHIIRQVVEGYLAIEEKKIVHRDIKTANIFLTGSGARIADFGFCEFLNETKKPQVFYNVGSPAYMSPESYRDNIYSPKSDLWSIGIILYEMLVGDTPDKNLTYSEMSNNLMAGRIGGIGNEEIKRILAGCFKKDLKERFSPTQLLEAVSNEIARLEQPKNMVRPQTVQPNTTNHRNSKPIQMASVFPVTPNEMTGQRHIHNRHMVSSAQPIEYHSEGLVRSQSPFKPRFVNQLGKDEHPSPLKQQFERRFRDESPLRGPVKEQQNNKVKGVTEVLLFLYRLLSFLGESEFEGVNFMRLILFRHRSYLESAVERIMGEERQDRGSYQPFKEFQFLKSRFDEAYLQKESQSPSHPLPTQVISKLNELANQPFTEANSLVIYCGLIVDTCKECDRIVKGVEGVELSKIGGLWDYLMVHFQILELYAEGCAVDKVSETIGLAIVLKDQPKKISAAHCELLRIKLRSIQEFFQYWNAEVFHEKRGEDSNGKINDIPERKFLINNGFF